MIALRKFYYYLLLFVKIFENGKFSVNIQEFGNYVMGMLLVIIRDTKNKTYFTYDISNIFLCIVGISRKAMIHQLF